MKPQIIFTAVFAVCLLLGIGLPQIARGASDIEAPAPVESVYVPQTAGAETGGEVSVVADPAVSAAGSEPAVIESGQTVITDPAAAGAEEAVLSDQALPAELPPVDNTTLDQESEELPAPVFANPEGLPTPTPLIPGANGSLPDLVSFAGTVTDGSSDVVRGVYVPGLFALPIVEQPPGNENYIAGEDGVITRYAIPGQFGSIGLIAHNYLSGRAFINLKENQEIVLVYGDGRTAAFRVSGLQYYQAISPADPYSNFVDLSDPARQILSYSQVFNRVYTTAGQVVFQTCFEANGDPSWGRVFVIADPL